MRKSVAISLLVLTALSCVRGQDQERKLLDRLLKPDMTLQNDAQHKNFVADGEVFGVRYKGLPYEPVILVERGYSVIHSVKNDSRMTEEEIREFFRARRNS